MRPIDADTVSTILTRIIEEQKKSHRDDEVIGLMEARTEVNNAPTLDVKPVIHAHWIDQKHGVYKCSNCRNFLDFRGVNAGRGDANYCPNCGAKMDEEEKHETD